MFSKYAAARAFTCETIMMLCLVQLSIFSVFFFLLIHGIKNTPSSISLKTVGDMRTIHSVVGRYSPAVQDNHHVLLPTRLKVTQMQCSWTVLKIP